MKVDIESVRWTAGWYCENILCEGESFQVWSSATETFGWDFTPFSTNCGEKHVEVKTKNCPFGDWNISTTGDCVCFSLVPSTGHTIDKFQKYWESKPTQAQIQAQKDAEHESGELVRWFCLNAASGSDFRFDTKPKWLSMFNDRLSELVVLFSDGVLFFDHEALVSSVASYGYLKTRGREMYGGSRDRYWQFKVFLDIDKGRFYPCEVPQSILPRPKHN